MIALRTGEDLLEEAAKMLLKRLIYLRPDIYHEDMTLEELRKVQEQREACGYGEIDATDSK